jgi:hypothetical protein
MSFGKNRRSYGYLLIENHIYYLGYTTFFLVVLEISSTKHGILLNFDADLHKYREVRLL